MKRLREIIVLLTLLCYLAASSIASAHGFSSLIQKSTDLRTSQIALIDESKDMDCHSSQALQDENSNSSTCKIFCSVMAQAMTEPHVLISLDVEPLAAVPSFRALILSRQLAVETYPPK